MKTLILGAAMMLLVVPAPADAKRVNLVMDFGQDVLVAEKGEVSLRAQCIENEGGFDFLRLYARTTSAAVLRGSNTYSGNGNYLTPLTPAAASLLALSSAATGAESFSYGIDLGHVFNLASREGLAVEMATAVFGLNSADADCVLSIDVAPVKKFKEAQ